MIIFPSTLKFFLYKEFKFFGSLIKIGKNRGKIPCSKIVSNFCGYLLPNPCTLPLIRGLGCYTRGKKFL